MIASTSVLENYGNINTVGSKGGFLTNSVPETLNSNSKFHTEKSCEETVNCVSSQLFFNNSNYGFSYLSGFSSKSISGELLSS